MSLPILAAASGMPDTALPVLTAVVPESDVCDAMRAALDGLDHDKRAFMAMSDAMLDALRPDIERMATELVRNSLHQAWRMRSRSGD
ncbi:hypothetical protein [Limnohabitans sp. 2KL-27]|uniref:hypothetical protein n=1 Tax=Limnohabitans sp. 2KL-27 TaxID=1100705 RepID=UPI000A9FF1B1|nr:hypothetical protein [Limnohabitans sp. 2KL-27]